MNLISQNHHKQISHEDKQRLAYHLWEQSHRPAGMDVDFWMQAEQQLEAELANLREQPVTGGRKANPPGPVRKPAKRMHRKPTA
jgi:hypothetical protein